MVLPSQVPSQRLAPASAKQRVARVLPEPVVERLDRAVFAGRRARVRATRKVFATLGYNVVKRGDYYSTLPVLEDIEATRERWDRPSELVGVAVDLTSMSRTLADLQGRWGAEFEEVTGDYPANTRRGFGPGYPQLDARALYLQLREHRPRRYLEVGSGLSTYYASLAAERNAADGSPMQITCVEPYPFDALRTIEGIEVVEGFVQDVPLERFEALEAGDVLFIDSTHAFKIDSDVAFLFLEVLPRLNPGVLVHIHDVHFPFNGPFPADTWLFGERWPVYWNEAMLVQAFLAFNSSFVVELSTPMLRHADEDALAALVPDYQRLSDDPNPPSSLWLRRVS